MFKIKCDAELNTPEVIDRNELRATILITPYRFATDEAYIIWQDKDLRPHFAWAMGDFGLEILNDPTKPEINND